jgi:hypothetical protein
MDSLNPRYRSKKLIPQSLVEGGISPEATDSESVAVKSAISKSHTQGTDTTLGAQTSDVDMNSHKITNLTTPAANYDAATKKYVDDTMGGAGGGDMLKSTYDTNDDGRVNLAEGINDGTYSANAEDIALAVTRSHSSGSDSTLGDQTEDLNMNYHDIDEVSGLNDGVGGHSATIEELAGAVSVKHTQGTDTSLGTQVEDLDMGGNDIVSVVSLNDGLAGHSATLEEIAGAVSTKHTQGTDTSLGVQSEDLEMGGNDIKNVVGLDDGLSGHSVTLEELAGAVSAKHVAGNDTALGAQSEDLDLNYHDLDNCSGLNDGTGGHTATIENIAGAISAKHVAGNDTALGAQTEDLDLNYHDLDNCSGLNDGTGGHTATLEAIAGAVSVKHTQGTDTSLGIQAEDLEMGGNDIKNVVTLDDGLSGHSVTIEQIAGAVADKHVAGNDTALGAQTEDMDLNYHDLDNVSGINDGTGGHATTLEAILGAIATKHTQNTDTSMGDQTADLNMNSHKIKGLALPTTSGDAIRTTSEITETALESAIELSHTHASPVMETSVYDPDDNGIVNSAEQVSDGISHSVTAAQVDDAYQKRHDNSVSAPDGQGVTRSFGVTYTNGSHVRIVQVTVQLDSSHGYYAEVIAFCDTKTTPDTEVSHAYLCNYFDELVYDQQCLTLIVPANYKYKFSTVVAGIYSHATKQLWSEQDFS